MPTVAESLAKFSPASRAVAATLVATYLLQLIIPGFANFFGLVSGRAITRPWTLVTSGFVQQSFIQLALFAPAVLLLSPSVEAVLGHPGYAKFILISLAGSGALTFFLVTFVYYLLAVTMADDSAGDVLYTPICGFQGGLAALLIGIKQAVPDSEVTIASALRFKAKDVAALYLVGITVFGALTRSFLMLVPFSWFAAYVGWLYLRFFAYRADSFLRGDASPEFSFASFFPSAAQPVVERFSAACAQITRIQELSGSDAAAAAQSSAILLGRGTPSRDSSEASRRRERGARALEERLGLNGGAGGAGVKGAIERASSSISAQGLAAALEAVETGEAPLLATEPSSEAPSDA